MNLYLSEGVGAGNPFEWIVSLLSWGRLESESTLTTWWILLVRAPLTLRRKAPLYLGSVLGTWLR